MNEKQLIETVEHIETLFKHLPNEDWQLIVEVLAQRANI